MGIIDTWMKNHRTEVEERSQLFASGSESRLLEAVQQMDRRGDPLEAVRWLRAGTVRFHPWPEGELALDQMERIRARKSLGVLQDAVEQNYTASEAARLSEALDRLGDPIGATRWSRAAIQEDPCNPEGYLAIARSHLRGFRCKADAVAGLQALRYLTKACQLHSGHRECLRSLAMLLLLLKAPGAAAKVLRPLTKVAPEDPMVLALNALAATTPLESTSNIQELFLRWETGTTPDHSVGNNTLIACPDGIRVWELNQNRSLTATSASAERDADTAELFSVLAGTMTRTTEGMGLGEFTKFTARSHGNVLIGLAEPTGMTFCHTDRYSHEETLSRWLAADRGKESLR